MNENLSHHDLTVLRYREFEAKLPDIHSRTVAQQAVLLSMAPFDSPEYREAFDGLLIAKTDESDPDGNRVTKFRELGESLSFVSRTSQYLRDLAKKIEAAAEDGSKDLLNAKAGLDQSTARTNALFVKKIIGW